MLIKFTIVTIECFMAEHCRPITNIDESKASNTRCAYMINVVTRTSVSRMPLITWLTYVIVEPCNGAGILDFGVKRSKFKVTA